MVSKAFVQASSVLEFEALVVRLKRMRGTRSALALLEAEASAGQCSQSFVRKISHAFEPAQWGSDENLIARAAALAMTNPRTQGVPSVSTVVSAVVTGVMEEGARRRHQMMEEVIARHDIDSQAVPPPPRRRQREI